jgi:hypothetical protein
MVEDDLTQPIRAVSFGRVHRRERVRVFCGVFSHDVEAPRARGGPSCFAVPRVTLEHVLESFFIEHAQRFAQAVEKIRRRRVGKKS